VSRLRLSCAVVAGTLLLGAGPALAAGPYPPPSKGTGHVEPSRIHVGECAVFSGDGFADRTTVSISDNGTSRGTAVTNDEGEFSKQLCYPQGSQLGRHDLAGSGTGSEGDQLTVYAVLIVQGGPGGSSDSAVEGTTSGSGTGSGTGTGTGGGNQATVDEGSAVTNPDSAATTGGSSSGTSGATDASSSSGVFGSGLIAIPALGIGIALAALLLLLLYKRRRDNGRDEPDVPLDVQLA
jgi:hypothetical protein